MAGVAAMLVGGTLAGAALIGSASATSTFSFTRLGGINRFDTAAIIAQQEFPSGANTAILSTGYNFPDALAGNYLAGLKGAPVLLTTQSAPIPPQTLSALAALHTKNVIITGGTSAVGADIASALQGTTSTAPGGGPLNVTRVFGDNRYDTMQAIDMTPGSPVPVTTALLATGNDFPDALAAGPIAYALHYPVILTDGTQAALSPQAQAVINADGITHLIVAGGSAAINPSQYTNLPGVTIDEIAGGTDRSQTSQLLGDYAINHLGFHADHMNLANGFDPATDLPPGTPAGFTPDALAGGPHAAIEDATPIILTLNPTTPGSAIQFATEHAATLGTGHIFGGTAAVADSTAAAIAAAAGAPTPTTAPPTPPGGGLGTNPNTLGPNLTSCTITFNGNPTAQASKIQYVFDKPVLGTSLDPADYEIDGFAVSHFAVATGAIVDGSNPAAVDTTFAPGIDPTSFTVCTADNDSPTAGAAVANNGGGVSNPLETQLLGGSVVVPGQGTGATSCPDLLSATPTPGDGTRTKVDFTFDKQITVAPGPGGVPADYVFYDGSGTVHHAIAVVKAPGGNPVTATFPASTNVLTATRFAVLDGAVGNGFCGPFTAPPTADNPDGGLNVSGTSSPTPNVISVTRAGAPNIFTYTYDQNVTLVPANFASYHVYSNTGQKFTPTAASQVVQTGSTTIDVTFPGVTSSNTASIVEGTEANFGPGTAPVTGTVSGLPGSIGGAPIAVAGPGPTDGPVPISATRDNAANDATITFNQPICNTGGCVPVPGNFYVITANNVPTKAASVVSVSGNTITLHWLPAGAIANGGGVGVASSANLSEEGPFVATGAFNTDGIGNAPGTVALS